ncbi:MAG TPA: endo-1,4-beta-xylanase [Caulobacteraceae bacterium]
MIASALASGTLLAACRGRAEAAAPLLPLKDAASWPLGVTAMTGQFDDGGWTDIVRTHFDRVTPEWELKMETILQPDGSLNFRQADDFMGRAQGLGVDVFGHTVIWYAQGGPAFDADLNDRAAFTRRYDAYVRDVMSRWKGTIRAWDVVNEPVTDEATSLRDCVWSQGLGGTDAYIERAYRVAHEADPDALLFINEYHLELKPRKRATYMRLIERLLNAGAPLHGIGTQTHVSCDSQPGAIRTAVRELAGFGLPVHVSEVDVSTDTGSIRNQSAVFAEAAEAVAELPERQRFGLTIWGARDSDSWLRRGGEHNPLTPDHPLMFDDDGWPKPAAHAFRAALR